MTFAESQDTTTETEITSPGFDCILVEMDLAHHWRPRPSPIAHTCFNVLTCAQSREPQFLLKFPAVDALSQ